MYDWAMNRKPDGTLLTADDLATIALDAGLLTSVQLDSLKGECHNANLFFSALSEKTCKVRFAMFMAGKLNLDTRKDGDR